LAASKLHLFACLLEHAGLVDGMKKTALGLPPKETRESTIAGETGSPAATLILINYIVST
jgi:hypothetical protein